MDGESLSMYLAIKSVHIIVSLFYINEYCKYTKNINLISLQGNSEAWKIYCDFRLHVNVISISLQCMKQSCRMRSSQQEQKEAISGQMRREVMRLTFR